MMIHWNKNNELEGLSGFYHRRMFKAWVLSKSEYKKSKKLRSKIKHVCDKTKRKTVIG